MTLENSSLELINCLTVLQTAVGDFLVLITETRPYEHSLAYRFEHSTNDVLGRLDAALNAAIALQQVAGQFDQGEAFGMLATCHTEFIQAAEKFHNELKSYDWLLDLFALENEHPQEWLGWVTSIKATLSGKSIPDINIMFSPIHNALLRCWQSLLVSSGAISTRHIKKIARHTSVLEAEVASSESNP